MNDPIMIALIVLLVVFIIAFIAILIVYIVEKVALKEKTKKATSEADKILKSAEIKSDQILKNSRQDAKTFVSSMKEQAEKEIKERKALVIEQEKKLEIRENQINKRDETLTLKEQSIEDKKNMYDNRLIKINEKEMELQQKIDFIISELQKVAGLSQQQAKDEIMRRVEEKMSKQIALYIQQKQDEAELVADTKAKELLGLAMDKYAQDVTNERASYTISIPSDELKGRIIGREGRNIKSLENLLGVDIIIDDTPNCFSISCFNPIRREVARITLETLISDGRIQPGRIEEVFKKVTDDLNITIRKIGEQTCQLLGLPRISKELYDYIGRLKYRTSYGQNCLDHSIQVATLSGIMAAELGLDINLAKRAGLLHDIGKAADFEIEGSHVDIGVRLAKRFNEPEVVINAIASHHGDVPMKFVISNIVQAADTLSAARPGARNEQLENYIQRIEDIEKACKSFDGVQSCYAMQSGREVRVSVVPERVDDTQLIVLAQQIRSKLEDDIVFPGQIKVTVIRESRATEYTK